MDLEWDEAKRQANIRKPNMKSETTLNRSGTDLAKLDAMQDEDIDLSDLPEVTPEMFARAIVKRGLQPRTKTQLTLRVDSDVLDWFKEQGAGYQTRINALLRAYMEEHKAQTTNPKAHS